MSGTPAAAVITLRQALDLLDGPFEKLAEGVAEDRYAFWLGSGISFGRLPGLREIVPQVLEFLRSRIVPGSADCRFRAAMKLALGLASLSAAEWSRVDFNLPFLQWPDAAAIIGRLVGNYARLLDVPVDQEAEDYLVWNAVNVAVTYANPSIEPDVEHLCVAMLILEGTATDVATANWDGLIERAIVELSTGSASVQVCVHPDDLRDPPERGRLYKFHGCAVRAIANEVKYRPFLIARQSQINAWATRAEHAAIVHRLIDVLVHKPSLVMGLSAQDANIQALFAQAAAKMNWPWPGERPSYVFSEDQLGADQLGLLQNVYHADFNATTRPKIWASALIQAYARSLLVALVLHVLGTKLRRLVDLAAGMLAPPGRAEVQAGIRVLRDQMATSGEGDRLAFVRKLIAVGSRMIGFFRDGHEGGLPRRYNPISIVPLQQMATDPGLQTSGWCEAAVAVGVLGLGARDGLWSVAGTDPADPTSGVAQITSALSSARILLVANSHVALRLQQNGHLIHGEDVILVHSLEIPVALTRSPRSAPGRTGKVGLREVSIRTLLQESTSSSELVNRFRLKVAV
jgi:hypothetical protein